MNPNARLRHQKQFNSLFLENKELTESGLLNCRENRKPETEKFNVNLCEK